MSGVSMPKIYIKKEAAGAKNRKLADRGIGQYKSGSNEEKNETADNQK